jgi:hypothetical protein
MKFVKTIVTVAAISLLTVPAMAGNGVAQRNNNNLGIYQCSADCDLECQMLHFYGLGDCGVCCGGNGPDNDTGYGPGDGDGNDGVGPQDSTGNGAKTGDCVNE